MKIHRSAALVFFAVFGILEPAFATTRVPAQLPRPDQTPPVSDTPVKVYILSGQSNMVGFGRQSGAAPVYASIYLSADPNIKPCRMPVGSSALLPLDIYQSAAPNAPKGAQAAVYKRAYNPNADYAKLSPVKNTAFPLGVVAEKLPSVKGPHTVVASAFIAVPMDGAYELHAGYRDSTHAVITMDGKDVYRKEPGGEERLRKVTLETGRRYPITITYMKGGSAAFWMERVDLKGKGDLETLVKEEGRFPCLIDETGDWTQRTDVILNESYLTKKRFQGGESQPLSPTANGIHIGPELGFGYVMGTFHDEPVLLIKADTGNRSLAWDCLPPGSERYEVDGVMYAGYKDPQSRWKKGRAPKPGGWYAGKQYDEYTKAIHSVLDNFDTLYPQYKEQGYEVAGFVWWQGHKDQNPVHASRYEQNMVRLIKAWRKEFNAPDAKWVLATIAFGGWNLDGPGLTVANAQLAVSGDSGKYPEFKGNVKTVEARGFWRSRAESPTGAGYHYNHNAETYMLTGDALGRAMVELLGGKADPRKGAARPPRQEREWPENPDAEQAVEMIYSDAFIRGWRRAEAEPSAAERAKMGPALAPIILGKLIPAYVQRAPRVPRYRRYGIALTTILDAAPEKQRSTILTSQLDKIIEYYNAAGVHEYDWKPFGPNMKTAVWHYYSFDPPEKQAKSNWGRNREISYPEGMANWYAADFDAAAAGWQTGKAPFGQKNAELKALRPNCRDPHCGCGITPNTFWEKEVLLMRQTFEIPELKKGHRYRLVVGGSAHSFSGEGFSLYVNGKLFAESEAGHYKGKGGVRGGYVFKDFLPELKSGRVTIAVKGFLRYTHHKNKVAPPSGHLSAWLEQAKIAPVAFAARQK